MEGDTLKVTASTIRQWTRGMCFARQSYATFARTNTANALEFLNNIQNFITLWPSNKFNQKITFADPVIKIAAAAALTCKLRRAKLANRRIVKRVRISALTRTIISCKCTRKRPTLRLAKTRATRVLCMYKYIVRFSSCDERKARTGLQTGARIGVSRASKRNSHTRASARPGEIQGGQL